MTGVIKRMKEGYGFISPTDGGKDVFFHANDCANHNFNDLKEGDNVNFEMGESPKGPKATGVAVA